MNSSESAKKWTQLRERGNLVADLTIQRSRTHNDINNVLTDTQREQMKQMREKHRQEHRNKA